jgi:hypothetical protein
MPKPVASFSASSKTIRQFCLIHCWLADEAAAQRFWSLRCDISSRKSVLASASTAGYLPSPPKPARASDRLAPTSVALLVPLCDQ